ncbi:MAG TPA: chloride channel protein [Terriglobales bacterium]|jgi:CIC family chloride channel protein|nr:chloride channel protein [Terriglobales bacterium]
MEVNTISVTNSSGTDVAVETETTTQGERFFLVLAIFIGLFSGLSVVCFRIAIDFIRITLLGSSLSPSYPRVLLAPTITGLLIAALVVLLFQRVRGSGVNQTKAALYIYDGYIPFRTAIGKFICSALAIGSGQSLGPEDPSLQIGAAIASALGRLLKLGREQLRLIAPIGAAAGLAAAFNSPISAVLFVIEEVIGRWTAGFLGAVVLSAVSSVVVARYFLGSEPLFRIPPVQFIAPAELLAYALLGIIGAVASVVFARAIQLLRPKMKALPRWTQLLQPGFAGLMIGLIALAGRPEIMGAGYEYIDQAMHGQFVWQIMAILAGLKILATVLSFVSGTPGGMFAPTLFVGAMLGGAVGAVELRYFPHLTGSIGTYALVGIGVLFAGFLRAPLTSVFMVLEVSGNYSIIVPVILANTLAYLISRNLQPIPIFDMLSKQDGLDLPSMEEQREERVLRVEDAMRPVHVPVVDSQLPIRDALKIALEQKAKEILVDDPPFGWSSLTTDALRKALAQHRGQNATAQILPEGRMPQIYPDNRLEVALRHISPWPFLPVMHRADPGKLVGVVALQDIMKAFGA